MAACAIVAAGVLGSTPATCSAASTRALRRPALRPLPQRKAFAIQAEDRDTLGSRYTGYVEKDTAGQENVYAVEPTVYVGGPTSSSSGSTAVLLGAAVLVLLGAGASLVVLSNVDREMRGVYSGPTLSALATKFEAELAAAAPAVQVEVASAPPTVIVAEEELLQSEAAPQAVAVEEVIPTWGEPIVEDVVIVVD